MVVILYGRCTYERYPSVDLVTSLHFSCVNICRWSVTLRADQLSSYCKHRLRQIVMPIPTLNSRNRRIPNIFMPVWPPTNVRSSCFTTRLHNCDHSFVVERGNRMFALLGRMPHLNSKRPISVDQKFTCVVVWTIFFYENDRKNIQKCRESPFRKEIQQRRCFAIWAVEISDFLFLSAGLFAKSVLKGCFWFNVWNLP